MKRTMILLVVALLTGGRLLNAQPLGIEYTYEFQANLKDYKWVNLLRLNTDILLSRHLSLEAASISIARTSESSLINDLQAFSSIEEQPTPLTLAVGGLRWETGDRHCVHIGIRNMNEDYFTSELTSFFSNSSCGVYPTISANYPIANYPYSSLGIHYKYQTNHRILQASLYNGLGYGRISGRESIFQFKPDRDGLWGIGEMRSEQSGGTVSLGLGVHWNHTVRVSPWLYWEQQLNSAVSLLAGCSHAWGSPVECSDFVGIGMLCRIQESELGFFTDLAQFSSAREWATELDWKISLSGSSYLQAVVHLIRTDGVWGKVFCLRLGFTL